MLKFLTLDIFLVESANAEERRVILKHLNTTSTYEAFMMVSTFGGSLNGSTIYVKMSSFGWYHILIYHLESQWAEYGFID